MPIAIKMPALSPTMEEGTLARWLVKVGDKVSSGDIMAEIETDKATMEFEAVDEGTIADIAVAEGTEGVKVGTVIATLGRRGRGSVEVKPASGDAAPAPAPKAEAAEAIRRPSESWDRCRNRAASCQAESGPSFRWGDERRRPR